MYRKGTGKVSSKREGGPIEGMMKGDFEVFILYF